MEKKAILKGKNKVGARICNKTLGPNMKNTVLDGMKES
jgi:hypothetical protein